MAKQQKKKNTKKVEKKNTVIKISVEPQRVVRLNGVQYNKQSNGLYLKKGTKELFEIVKG